MLVGINIWVEVHKLNAEIGDVVLEAVCHITGIFFCRFPASERLRCRAASLLKGRLQDCSKALFCLLDAVSEDARRCTKLHKTAMSKGSVAQSLQAACAYKIK